MDSGTVLPDPDRPYLDLFAAETGALIAHLDLILGDALDARAPGLRSPAAAPRCGGGCCGRTAQRDDWPWYTAQGSNWNPWIHSNVLASGLLLDESGDELLDTVVRVVGGLDNFLDGSPADGGCDEGAMYWWRSGATLFECLDTLHRASGGALDAFAHPMVRAIARYPLVTHIDGAWQVNYADGTAVRETDVVPSRLSSNPPDLLHRFGRRVGDPQVCAHARAMRGAGRSAGRAGHLAVADPGRSLRPGLDGGTRRATTPTSASPGCPTPRCSRARARGGSAEGLFLSAKGGHNDEGHNHNDIGTFVVALDGDPVLVDVGVGEYDRATFGPDRYSIWTMRSAYHNLPQIERSGTGGRRRLPGQATYAPNWARRQPTSAWTWPGRTRRRRASGRWRRTLTLHRTGTGRVELRRDAGNSTNHPAAWNCA